MKYMQLNQLDLTKLSRLEQKTIQLGAAEHIRNKKLPKDAKKAIKRLLNRLRNT